MRKSIALLITLMLLGIGANALAQTSTWGLVQTWYSYNGLDEANLAVPGTESYAQTSFAMKRMRIGVEHKWDDFTGFFFYDAVPAKAVDAWIKYRVNDQFDVQAGRFRGVGSQAGGLTPPTKLELVDYSLVGKGWAGNTHGGDSRTIGVQGNFKVNDMTKVSVLLHNGNGNGTGMFATNDTAPAMGETGFLPKIDAGIYVKPTDETKFAFTFGLPNEFRMQAGGEFITAITGFGQYRTDEFSVRFDVVSLDSKGATWDNPAGVDDDYKMLGYAVTGTMPVNEQLEFAGRYDFWDPNTDVDDDAMSNVTVGANWAFLPDAPYDQRLQANVILRMDEVAGGGDLAAPLVFQVQWQAFIH